MKKNNWEKDVIEVYKTDNTYYAMSLRKEEMIWESEVVEVLKIENRPNGQDFWIKDHTQTNDQEETYGDCTLEQRYRYTPDNRKGRAHMWGQRLTYGKKGKINLMSDMVLVSNLFLLLLEYSITLARKGRRHTLKSCTKPNYVLVIGAKNTARTNTWIYSLTD